MADDGKAVEFVIGQVDALRSAVERHQTKAPRIRTPSSLLPCKKRKCMAIKEEAASSKEVMAIMGVGLERPEPVGMPMEICLDDKRPERTLKVGSVLDSRLKNELVELLKEFEDVFAYNVEEMLGIDPDVAIHKLNIDPDQKSVR